MNMRTCRSTSVAALKLITMTGHAVMRGQEAIGASVDDVAITARTKARFGDNPQVEAVSLSVGTLDRTVMLSGFAKNATQRTMAGDLTRGVNGVKAVKNESVVRP